MDSFTTELVPFASAQAADDVRIEVLEPVDNDNGSGGSSSCVIA